MTDHTTKPRASDDTPTPASRPARRLRRWLVRAVVVAVLCSAGWWGVTRSPLVTHVVRDAIAARTGLVAEIDRAELRPFGVSRVVGLRLRAPAMDASVGASVGASGDASVIAGAEVLEVEEIRVTLSPWDALFGAGAVETVEIREPVVHASQSARTGDWNLTAVIRTVRERLLATAGPGAAPPGGGGGAVSAPAYDLPEISIEGFVLEIGEHDLEGATPTRVHDRLVASGRLVADGAGSYRIEVDDHPDLAADADPGVGAAYFSGSGLRVEVGGVVTTDGIDLAIGALDLSDIDRIGLPARTREVLDIMGLEGRLESVRLRGGGDEPVSATLAVEGVGVTLPIDPTGAFATEGRLLRMTGTTGAVEVGPGGLDAQLEGVIGGLPYTVRWASEDLSPEAAFEAEFAIADARIRPESDLLLFVPQAALEPFDLFGRPTFTVDARVTLTRPAGGRVALLGVVGFRDGEASYQRFPYPFGELEGTMSFTDERVEIHRIAGIAENGATVLAHGWMGPYDNNARADITIECTGVPLDDALRDAMEPDTRRVFDLVFSQRRHAELLEAGLVRPPGAPPRAGDRPDGGPGHAPEFALGGTADVTVRVTRTPGPVGERWDTHIEAAIAEAGLVPEPFAYPIRAQDITLRATETSAVLTGGRYIGLSGGGALMDAQIGLGRGNDEVRIDIRAVEIPVDDRLVHALPNPESAEESVQRIVDRLNVEGVVDANAYIRRRENGRIGYDVEVTLNGIGANPDAGALRLDEVAGTAFLTEEFLLFDAVSRVSAPGLSGASPTVELTASVDLAPPENGAGAEGGAGSPRAESLRVRAASAGFDPSLPMETLVALFAPGSASSMATLRERHAPAGSLDLDLELDGREGAPPAIMLTVSAVDRFEIDALEGRVGLGNLGGLLEIGLGDAVSVDFDRCVFDAWYDDDPLGRVRAVGGLVLDDERGVMPAPGGFALDAGRLRFESPFVRTIAARMGGPDLAALLDRTDPRGETRVEVRYDPAAASTGAPGADGANAEPAVEARISPDTVRLVALSDEIKLVDVDGSFVVGRRGGRLEGLSGTLVDPDAPDATGGSVPADAGGPRITLDGPWSLIDGVFDMPVRVSARSAGRSGSGDEPGPPGAPDAASPAEAGPPDRRDDALGPELLALLPSEAVAALDGARVRVGESLVADAILVHLVRAPGEALGVRVDGALDVAGLSATPGAPLEDGRGRVRLSRSPDGGFDIALALEELRVTGVRATDGRVRIVREGESPVTSIEGLVAEVHGGRLAGHGALTATGGGAAGAPETAYEMTVSASGVGFDALLGDLRDGGNGTSSSDSRLRAELTVSGTVGRTVDRAGRGLIELDGTRLIDLPLILPLIEVSNLQVPSGERLEMARTEFFISGDFLTFDELSAFSESVELFGYGVMSLPGMELDLRIHSEAVRKVPVISEIVEGVRDELVTASVTGTLKAPEVGTTGLRGTRRLIAAVLGVQPSDDERRLEEIERRARERRRSRAGTP